LLIILRNSTSNHNYLHIYYNRSGGNEILERIEQKLDTLQKDVTEIEIVQARFEAEVKGDLKVLQGQVNTLKEDVRDIKGSQKAQIWSLITILSTVALGAVVRFVITAMPAGNP
jgi:hypothetical protein